MSGFYDPWVHAINLFLNRIVLFLLLSFVLALLILTGLLHYLFDAAWKNIWRWLFGISQTRELIWLGIAGLCLALGAAITGWLFTWLTLKVRLPKGDHFQRGARLVSKDYPQ